MKKMWLIIGGAAVWFNGALFGVLCEEVKEGRERTKLATALLEAAHTALEISNKHNKVSEKKDSSKEGGDE